MTENNFHRLLKRQIKNYLTVEHLQDEKIVSFLNNINNAYNNYDNDYKHLEHILELSNKESFKALKDIQFALNQVASVFTMKNTGEILEANQLFFQLTEYQSESVIGNRYTDVFKNSEDIIQFISAIKESLNVNQVWRGEITIETASGHKLFTSTSIIPIYNNENIIIKYLFISFDISEEKKAKENLLRSEEKYRSIISNINLGLLEVDLNETILMVNQGFCNISGFDKEELIGKKTYEVVINANTLPLIESKQKLRNDNVSDAYEIEVFNKMGDKRYWLISGAPMFNDIGKHVGSIGIHLDITDRKENEEKMKEVLDTLQKVNKELNEFAYIVSHDLKAPLRAIGSLASWLNEDYADNLDKEGKEALSFLVQRTQRMHNLIDGILNYSKIGRTKENKTKVNTQNLVENIIDSLQAPKHIQLIIDNILPEVYFDEIKLQQIFQNLISNAIKFIDKPKGEIHISSKLKNNSFEFSIKDNGPGIKKEYHNKIFQIFQTLNSRDEYESTGIGLTIVKKIIENNGGEIWVDSENNDGTTFLFTIKK